MRRTERGKCQTLHHCCAAQDVGDHKGGQQQPNEFVTQRRIQPIRFHHAGKNERHRRRQRNRRVADVCKRPADDSQAEDEQCQTRPVAEFHRRQPQNCDEQTSHNRRRGEPHRDGSRKRGPSAHSFAFHAGLQHRTPPHLAYDADSSHASVRTLSVPGFRRQGIFSARRCAAICGDHPIWQAAFSAPLRNRGHQDHRTAGAPYRRENSSGRRMPPVELWSYSYPAP